MCKLLIKLVGASIAVWNFTNLYVALRSGRERVGNENFGLGHGNDPLPSLMEGMAFDRNRVMSGSTSASPRQNGER